jgi:Domain of unknown function (DUF4260)
MDEKPVPSGVVRNSLRLFLRLEGAVLLGVSLFLYARYGQAWGLFALLLLAPDVGMLGYLADTRIGAMTYNLFHTYLGPGVLLVVGIAADSPATYSIAFIWFAHIGFDRVLGYGLKYGESFKHTHLGVIGGVEKG